MQQQVDYASIELKLREDINRTQSGITSAGIRMRNALVMATLGCRMLWF